MAKGRRTTHRSGAGRKLYAVRDAGGRFKDIQTYERAHGRDIKRRSKAEQSRKGKQPDPKGARRRAPKRKMKRGLKRKR